MDLTKLAEPFPAEQVEWRIQRKNKEKTKGYVIPYIRRRAIIERLNAVCGAQNWQDVYRVHPGGILCSLSIRCGASTDELGVAAWVSKEDVSENTEIEAVKGGVTGAFKRAASKWTIGLFLEGIDGKWVEINDYGDFREPELPAWALPEGSKTGSSAASQPAQPEQGTDPTHLPLTDRLAGRPDAATWQAALKRQCQEAHLAAVDVSGFIGDKFKAPTLTVSVELWLNADPMRTVNPIASVTKLVEDVTKAVRTK